MEYVRAVEPVVLRVEDLDDDDKGVKEILENLLDSGHHRLDLALLQDKSDTSRSNFRDLVYCRLLVWMDTSLSNFTWLWSRLDTTRSPPESSYGYNVSSRITPTAPPVILVRF